MDSELWKEEAIVELNLGVVYRKRLKRAVQTLNPGASNPSTVSSTLTPTPSSTVEQSPSRELSVSDNLNQHHSPPPKEQKTSDVIEEETAVVDEEEGVMIEEKDTSITTDDQDQEEREVVDDGRGSDSVENVENEVDGDQENDGTESKMTDEVKEEKGEMDDVEEYAREKEEKVEVEEEESEEIDESLTDSESGDDSEIESALNSFGPEDDGEQVIDTSFNRLLKPIKEGSTLLIPRTRAIKKDPRIGQAWMGTQLGKRIRVECKDGRIFEGSFHCIDSDGNVILKDSEWINGGLYGTEKKPVGLCLCTRKWIKRLYIAAPLPVAPGIDDIADTVD